MLIKHQLDPHLIAAAKPLLRKIARNPVIGGFRGASSGGLEPELKRDGTLSGQNRVPDHEYLRGAKDGVLGFYDRSPRENYCRMTAYTQKNLDDYVQLLPYVQEIEFRLRERLRRKSLLPSDSMCRPRAGIGSFPAPTLAP